MKGWFPSVCKAFIFAASLSFLIGILLNSPNSTDAYISGYSITLLATLLILTNAFSNIFRETSSGASGIINLIYAIFMSIGPFGFMIALLGLVIYLITKNRALIINEDVPSNYIWYNESIVLLVMIQLLVIYTGVSSDKFDESGQISSLFASMLYLSSVLMLISYITLQSILTNYTTDGFGVR
jgi:cell shape-determining protein MreD